MSICSLIVYSRPEKMEAVSADINGREGCEVAAAENGKMVVLIDTPSRDVMSQAIMDMNDIPGVITVSFIYEYFEEDGTSKTQSEDA
jgi:nitrate reductase NapD